MLEIYAWDMIFLVALGWMLHTFPFHVNLMIMKPWLLMLEVYMITDVEWIEEFVAFKGAYEIESLFEKFEAFDDDVYRP